MLQLCPHLSGGVKTYSKTLVDCTSTSTCRYATDCMPAELDTLYCRVYRPGRQVPSVRELAVHLRRRGWGSSRGVAAGV